MMFSLTAHAVEYRLAMSKDDKLCKYVKKSYENAPRKYNDIDYDNVGMFSSIKWNKFLDSHDSSKYSIIDINHDGMNEIVIIGYGSAQGLETSYLSIYPLNELDLLKKYTIEKFKKSPGKIGLSSLSYPLKEFSIKPLKDEANYSIDSEYYLLSAIKVLPFIFEDKIYVVLQDWPNAIRRKWLLVAKYNSGELWGVYKPKNDSTLSDICYLELK